MSEAVITNALLRCRRGDALAGEIFELVRADLGLWVLELPSSFEGIIDTLSGLRPFLKALKAGSSDYTLHVSATVDEVSKLMIPIDLAGLSAECGFSIELVGSEEE